jgi:hypothetical protein
MDAQLHFRPDFNPEDLEDGRPLAPCVPLVLAYSLSQFAPQIQRCLFPDAKHFVVAGGKFKSITNFQQPAPSTPPGELGPYTLSLQAYSR